MTQDSADMSARPVWLSPSLVATPDGSRPAFELKFAVPPATADALQGWAVDRLQRDPHSDPEFGYLITSTYYDTPAYDVFRRATGFDVHKYRARRYGTEPTVHLERKSKADGRVWKVRGTMPLADLGKPLAEWGVGWFASDVAGLGLRPVCAVSYRRSAFVGDSPCGGVRLTIDRSAWGVPAAGVSLDPVTAGTALLSDVVVVELKFLAALPVLFKEAVEKFQLRPTGVSKYRRCVRAAGLCADPAAGAGDA
jgi:hypothetical protein